MSRTAAAVPALTAEPSLKQEVPHRWSLFSWSQLDQAQLASISWTDLTWKSLWSKKQQISFQGCPRKDVHLAVVFSLSKMAAVATAVPIEEPVRAEPAMPAVTTVIQTPAEDRYGSLSTLQLVFTAVWLFLAFSGWVLLMGGLSGFQKNVNKHKNTDLWAIPANYPYLTPHHILRWDWYACFAYFLIWCMVVAVLAFGNVASWRGCLIGFLTTGALYYTYETDRMYNIRTFQNHGSNWARVNCAFSGGIVGATSFYMLIFCLGVDPEAWPF